MTAADALENLESVEATPTVINALINALQSSNYKERQTAAQVLEILESPKATPPLTNALINALQQDSDDRVRQAVASALRNLRFDEAIPSLINALQDSSKWVQWRAAEALGEFGDSDTLSQLWERYCQSSDIYFYQAIADIQERCGFYNYDLMQKAQNLGSDRS